jgi:hypothetical protein
MGFAAQNPGKWIGGGKSKIPLTFYIFALTLLSGQ